MPTNGGPPDDPRSIHDRTQFAAALQAIREQQGRSIRELAKDAGIPPATLSGYFTGRYLPAATQRGIFEKLLAALGLGDADAWWEALLRARKGRTRAVATGVPYRGLNSYSVADAPWYVGREELTNDLVEAVTSLQGSGEPRFLLVIGASGAGKTSLLRAGLQARLLESEVRCAYLVPGQQPLASLQQALTTADGQLPQLLVVDQFEEIFAPSVTASERGNFVHRLIDLASDQASSTVVVMGLRADFFGEMVSEPELFPHLNHQFRVGPLNETQLRRVITEPIQRAGGSIDPELVDQLVRDSARASDGHPLASALPLTSHALLSAWEASGDGQLTAEAYDAAGGIEGAVRRTADQIYEQLSASDRSAAESLFALLTSVDAEGRAIRRRVDHATVDATAPDQVVEAFLDGRVLGADEHNVEICHDTVLTAWPRLAEWIARDRDRLRTRERISQAALSWQESGHDPGMLLRGTLLGLAGDLESWSKWLTPLERDYIGASRELAATTQRRRVQGQRRLRAVTAMAVCLAVVASVLSVYLFESRRASEEQRQAAVAAQLRAMSRQGAAAARELRAKDQPLALQLALAAYQVDPTVEARSALLEASGQQVATRLVGPSGTTKSVVSPGGALLAVAGVDGVVRLFRRNPDQFGVPEPIGSIEANPGEQLYAATFSPNGRLLAVGGSSGDITMIDVSDPEHPRAWDKRLTAPTQAIQGLAFTRNRLTLVAATSDSIFYAWKLEPDPSAASAPIRAKLPNPGGLYAVDTLPHGLIVTGGGDGQLRVWRIRGDVLEQTAAVDISSEAGTIYAVAANPSGTQLATGSNDNQVRLWRMVDGKPKVDGEPLDALPSRVNAVDFSDDGSQVAAAASGATVMLWQTNDRGLIGSFPGTAHYGSVQILDSGRALVASGIDGVTRLWPLSAARNVPLADTAWSLAATADGQRGYVGIGGATVELDLAEPGAVSTTGQEFTAATSGVTLNGCSGVSPDGRLVAAGTSEGTLLVWRLRDGRKSGPPVTVPVHDGTGNVPGGGGISNVMFSADGTHAYASTLQGTIAAYRVVGGSLDLLDRFNIKAMAMAFSIHPDGTRVAVGAADNSVRILDLINDAWVDRATLTGPQNYAYMTAFSPDGQTVITGSEDRRIYRWDLSDPTKPRPIGTPLEGPESGVYSVAYFGPELIGGASLDGRLWLWRGEGDEMELWARLEGLGAEMYQLLALPHRDSALVAGIGASMTEFSVDPETVAKQVCTLAGDPITRAEWRRYLPGAAYSSPCPSKS